MFTNGIHYISLTLQCCMLVLARGAIPSLPACCFAVEELVYLTADSPDTITQLEKSKVYILGGLVDRNAHKGLCFKKATVWC